MNFEKKGVEETIHPSLKFPSGWELNTLYEEGGSRWGLGDVPVFHCINRSNLASRLAMVIVREVFYC